MAINSNLFILLTVLVFTGLVVAEWQVLNPELDDTDDDVFFMPAPASSSSSSSSKNKGHKKQDIKASLAKKTYQFTPATDPWTVFQNVAFSSNQPSENNHPKDKNNNNNHVIKMTSSDKMKKTEKKHNFKSTSGKNKKIDTDASRNKMTHSNNNNNNNNKNIKNNNNVVDKTHLKTVVEKKNNNENLQKTEKKVSTLSSNKPGSTVDTSSTFSTHDFRQRDLLEVPDYSNDNQDNFEEINDSDNDDNDSELLEYQGLIVEKERSPRTRTLREEEEEEEELDCEDEINMSEYDCLNLQNERHRLMDEANMSEAGDSARQQLMEFMNLNNRHRRDVGDEGSGTETTEPDEEVITDGRYKLKRQIRFNVTITNSTDDVNKYLQKQLRKAFRGLKGFVDIKVDNATITGGEVVAEWVLTVRGAGVGAYGGNEVDVANGLQFQLLNLSKPLYDNIDLGGGNPIDPLNTRNIADTLASDLKDICGSENPCSTDFASCTVTGYNEGTCLHKCVIFESTRKCEHGGTCEIESASDGSTQAACQCTHNWEGTHCQSRSLDPGEITGVTVGAAVAALGLIGAVVWWLVCRRRRKPVNMTYYGDDSDSSERFSSPSSKISTFVIDRPRIRAAPIRSFSPHNHDDFSRPSTLSSLPPLMRPRDPANLFSDA